MANYDAVANVAEAVLLLQRGADMLERTMNALPVGSIIRGIALDVFLEARQVQHNATSLQASLEGSVPRTTGRWLRRTF